ncbi:MAG: LmbE family protein [Fluviicola sp.]|jgi:bacillithiol biosynthesis deacetylase BshB1|uniref:bacillithiol biosynthesis deacetylase BshB1 n=1 Tax=Fluviicola sp. TaxID=1917219 RepID=UPI002620F278|nr:bacillithiol biosynthesis deacetylase BshB1 [Fluviicola sp.]MDF3028774.1 LmbE family protein [Fluviicola sp.]
MNQIDVLAIGAHPDDVELSAAGTLLKHRALGFTTGVIDLTQGELGSRGSKEIRREEALAASEILGLTDRVNLKMADGFFEHSEENLRLIVEQIRRFKPQIVLLNAVSDRHPDHGKGSKLASEACFLAGLRRIETTWEGKSQEAHRPKFVYHYIQDRYLKPDFVIDVTDFVEQKFASIKAYKTQFWDPDSSEPKTPISGEEFFEFLRGRMAEFGRSIGVRYAEGFTVERILGVDSLFDLR